MRAATTGGRCRTPNFVRAVKKTRHFETAIGRKAAQPCIGIRAVEGANLDVSIIRGEER